MKQGRSICDAAIDNLVTLAFYESLIGYDMPNYIMCLGETRLVTLES